VIASVFLLTVRGRMTLREIAGSRTTTMFETVTAIFGFLSAGIFLAHAIDGYRSGHNGRA